MQLPRLEPCRHDFRPEHFGSTSDLLNDLGKGSEPVAIMLTCSELAYEVDHFSRANRGELIVIQTVGGLLHFDPSNVDDNQNDPLGCTLEYESVRHFIVCGHSDCEVFNLLLNFDAEKPKLMVHTMLESVEQRLRNSYADRCGHEHRLLLIQESVLQQLANVLTRADFQRRLNDANLLLHAWVRYDKKSTIAAFDPVSGQFAN